MVTDGCGGIVRENGGRGLCWVKLLQKLQVRQIHVCHSPFFFALPLFLSVLTSMSPVSLGPISILAPPKCVKVVVFAAASPLHMRAIVHFKR